MCFSPTACRSLSGIAVRYGIELRAFELLFARIVVLPSPSSTRADISPKLVELLLADDPLIGLHLTLTVHRHPIEPRSCVGAEFLQIRHGSGAPQLFAMAGRTVFVVELLSGFDRSAVLCQRESTEAGECANCEACF